MREIKFRAWDTLTKQMMHEVEGAVIMAKRNIEFKVMQYTGLKDKNGKEIYEGDIVKSCNEHIENITGVVCWNEKAIRFQLDTGSGLMNMIYTASLERCEVIGNIYENPELLEVK